MEEHVLSTEALAASEIPMESNGSLMPRERGAGEGTTVTLGDIHPTTINSATAEDLDSQIALPKSDEIEDDVEVASSSGDRHGGTSDEELFEEQKTTHRGTEPVAALSRRAAADMFDARYNLAAVPYAPRIDALHEQLKAECEKIDAAETAVCRISGQSSDIDDVKRDMAFQLYSLKQQLQLLMMMGQPLESNDARGRYFSASGDGPLRSSRKGKHDSVHVHVVRDYDEAPLPYPRYPHSAVPSSQRGHQENPRQSQASVNYSSDWTSVGQSKASFGRSSIPEETVNVSGSGSWE
jgi:hypothetical protein